MKRLVGEFSDLLTNVPLITCIIDLCGKRKQIIPVSSS